MHVDVEIKLYRHVDMEKNMPTIALEIMANLVKSLQISLIWFTNITAFTTGDNLSIGVEDK